MSNSYLFKSERLGFRNWIPADIPALAAINSDPDVMAFFPSLPDRTQTEEFVARMQKMYARIGFCYFAVDRLDTGEFIGFIGLSEQDYDVEFCPCVDIGWRIDKAHWNLGFATEGAAACLTYGRNQLNLSRILSVAPLVNVKSIKIMEKIGMQAVSTFDHPALENYPDLLRCIYYSIES